MVKSVFYNIICDPEEREKLNSLKDQRAIYKLFLDNGYSKKFDVFKAEVDDFLTSDEVRKIFSEEDFQLPDDELEMISGGVGMKRVFVASLSSLMVGFNLLNVPSVCAIPPGFAANSEKLNNSNGEIVKGKIKNGADNVNELPIVYSDNYFSKTAYEDNLPLATASLALELSSFSAAHYNQTKPNHEIFDEKDNDIFGFEDVSSEFNKDQNVKSAFKSLGFDNIKSNEYFNAEAKSDGIGVAVGKKGVEVKENGQNKKYTLIPVVVRGGGYDSEWAGNFEVGAEGNHSGFEKASDQVKKFVDDYIKEAKIEGNVKLWIVGYSRAGATAGLVGYKYNRAVDEKKTGELGINLEKNNIYTYTFEAPNNFLKSGENNVDGFKNIHNFINKDDLVTKVPFVSWNFGRVGVEHELKVDSKSDLEWRTNEILNKFDLKKTTYYKGNKAETNWYGGFKNFKEYGQAFDELSKSIDKAIASMCEKENIKVDNVSTRKYYAKNIQPGLMKVIDIFQKRGSNISKKVKKELRMSNLQKIGFLLGGLAYSGVVEYKANGMLNSFNEVLEKEGIEYEGNELAEEEIEYLSKFFRELDKTSNLAKFLYFLFNKGELANMHKPPVHLAVLIAYLEKQDDEECKKIYEQYSQDLKLTNLNGDKPKILKSDSNLEKKAREEFNDSIAKIDEFIEEAKIKGAYKFFLSGQKGAREDLKTALQKKLDENTEKYIDGLSINNLGALSEEGFGNLNYLYVWYMPFNELTKSFDDMLIGICKDAENGGKVLDDGMVDCFDEGQFNELKKAIKEYNESYKIAKRYESDWFGKGIKSVYNTTNKYLTRFINKSLSVAGLKIKDEDENLKWMNARKNVYKSMDKVLKLLDKST